MKTRVTAAMLMILSLGAFGAVAATAQHEDHSTHKGASQSTTQGKKAMSHDQMSMANEPHHVLAMAYHQNLAAFAKVLQKHAAGANSVNVGFARAAVTEMRRSFDQMKRHHQEHMQTMSADMHTRMSGMMKQMVTHQAELNGDLTALEQEVRLSTPDAKRVSRLAASVHSHGTSMSMMKQDGKGSTMRMKM
jgi:cytochrome c556